jgi:hypothetical protein
LIAVKIARGNISLLSKFFIVLLYSTLMPSQVFFLSCHQINTSETIIAIKGDATAKENAHRGTI